MNASEHVDRAEALIESLATDERTPHAKTRPETIGLAAVHALLAIARALTDRPANRQQ